MNVRSDRDGTVHRPTFDDARVLMCGRRIVDHETFWLADQDELTCEECEREATDDQD